MFNNHTLESMYKKLLYFSLLGYYGAFGVSHLYAQETIISVDLTSQKFIGENSALDRSKYFNVHMTYLNWDMSSDWEYFQELDVYGGRSFHGPSAIGKGGKYVLKHGPQRGEDRLNISRENPVFEEGQTSDIIVTQHPASLYTTEENPGKIADYTIDYLSNAFEIIPDYIEVLNEPFVHAKDFEGDIQANRKQMSLLWKKIGQQIHREFAEVRIGGYAAAWPEFDKDNFQQWEKTQQLFMDTAGEEMDFFSVHLYDGLNANTGTFNYRSGSNSEGILDLIESYSYAKFGFVKPHVISEYGMTVPEWLGQPYDEKRDALILRSVNSLHMSLLDKDDRLYKAVPFITGKANWFYTNAEKNPEGQPYPWVMKRKTKEGTYEFTHLIKFYELWSDVSGDRIFSHSTNPDIQVHSFVDTGNQEGYIAINNMTVENQPVNIQFINGSKAYVGASVIKRLRANQKGIPELIEEPVTGFSTLVLRPEETIIITAPLTREHQFTNEVYETNYYTERNLIDIVEDQEMNFVFDNVIPDRDHVAYLRMNVGRAHGLSLRPELTFNGNKVHIPYNWAGYDQNNRQQFFGVIAIPIQSDWIEEKNNVSLRFPDTGGKLASLVLNIESSETELGLPNLERLAELHATEEETPTVELASVEENVPAIEEESKIMTVENLSSETNVERSVRDLQPNDTNTSNITKIKEGEELVTLENASGRSSIKANPKYNTESSIVSNENVSTTTPDLNQEYAKILAEEGKTDTSRKTKEKKSVPVAATISENQEKKSTSKDLELEYQKLIAAETSGTPSANINIAKESTKGLVSSTAKAENPKIPAGTEKVESLPNLNRKVRNPNKALLDDVGTINAHYYLGTKMVPGKVFKEGLQIESGENKIVENFIEFNQPSAYVVMTKYPKSVYENHLGNTKGYIYVIKKDAKMIDVDEHYKLRHKENPRWKEFIILSNVTVDPSLILGAYRINANGEVIGNITYNPNYKK